jgi:hypothetical protein
MYAWKIYELFYSYHKPRLPLYGITFEEEVGIKRLIKLFATALKNPNCKVDILEIRNEIIDEEARVGLVTAISNYHFLKSLDISDANIEMWVDMIKQHPSITIANIHTYHPNLQNIQQLFLQDSHISELELSLNSWFSHLSRDEEYPDYTDLELTEFFKPLSLNMNSGLTKLSFYGNTNEIVHLFKALETNTILKTLSLAHISIVELIELSKLLRKNSSISELNFKVEIEVGDDPIYVESFAQAGKKNVTIESMNIIYQYPQFWNQGYPDHTYGREVTFQESHVNKMICSFVVNNKSLKILTINHSCHDCIDIPDAIAMAKILPDNRSINYFSMIYTDTARYDFERMEVASSIKRALEVNPNLTVHIDAGSYLVCLPLIEDDGYKIWEPTSNPKSIAAVMLSCYKDLQAWLSIPQLRAQEVYIKKEMEKILPQSSCLLDAFIFADDLKHAEEVVDRFVLYKNFIDKLPCPMAKYFITLEQILIEAIPEGLDIMRISPSQLDVVLSFQDADRVLPSKEKFFEYANPIMSIIYMIDMDRASLIEDMREVISNMVAEDIPEKKSFQFHCQYNIFASIINLLLPEDMQSRLMMPKWNDEIERKWCSERSEQYDQYASISSEELARMLLDKLSRKDRLKSEEQFKHDIASEIDATGILNIDDIAEYLEKKMEDMPWCQIELLDLLGEGGLVGIYTLA